jgi:hypothetical protein
MPGSRKRTGHRHDDCSYWAGPDLVRMVCRRCRRVRLDLTEPSMGHGPEENLAVDCLGWLTSEPVQSGSA